MKYVRTKDKIIPYYDDLPTGKLGVVIKYLGRVEYNKVNEVFDEIVIKEADTIEELCDSFVFTDKRYIEDHGICYSLKQALLLCELCRLDWTSIKGAIWTDKGLIYVAKINDKKRLELLNLYEYFIDFDDPLTKIMKRRKTK